MRNKLELTMDSMLTVKEAASLTNLSVPTFYTPQRKRDFGFDDVEKNDTWLIPVHLLVKHGLLTEDFEPTRSRRTLGSVAAEDVVEELQVENRSLRDTIGELSNRISVLEVLVNEKDKQLEMLQTLISQIGQAQKERNS